MCKRWTHYQETSDLCGLNINIDDCKFFQVLLNIPGKKLICKTNSLLLVGGCLENADISWQRGDWKMLKLADKEGRWGLANADSTDKKNFKKIKQIFFLKGIQEKD